MKKWFGIVCITLIAVMLCACSAPQAQPKASDVRAEATATPSPTPSPAPSPVPELTLESVTTEAFAPECYPAQLYPTDTGMRDYELIMEYPEITRDIVESFEAWADEVGNRMAEEYQSYGNVNFQMNVDVPSWQLLAAAAPMAASPEGVPAIFALCVDSSTEVVAGEDGETKATLTLTPKIPQVLFYELPNDTQEETAIPGAFFTCTYLLTLYDDNMELIENSGEYPELTEQLSFPFEERYDYRNGWYNDRDGGARRHTGTDILCPEGTPELACVDGTILAKGSGAGTGNYVILEGADKTQYHYYHMVEVSDLVSAGDSVKRGDPVGLAGNTGNSTANHLHLAIIAPNGMYVNPYPYLKDALPAVQEQ